jgi:serine/threonine protein kinase
MQPTLRYNRGDKIGGRYLIHQALGGGMGEVYLCRDLEKDLPLALKTFRAQYLSQGLHSAFYKEVATWVALDKHPNIVHCMFMDTLDKRPFMFLEWVASDENRGTDLRSWLRRGPLDSRLALDLTIDICRGLLHAGQKQPGLVHRDLKPENILIGQGRLAKLTDFGLAKIVQSVELKIKEVDRENPVHQQTTSLAGTPLYMAPEQWGLEELDARTDIYALGCVLYEMLTNHQPFIADTLESLHLQHLIAAVPKLPEDNPLSEALNEVLSKCMAKQKDERFANVEVLLQELSDIYQEHFAASPRPPLSVGEATALDLSNRGVTFYRLEQPDRAMKELSRAIEMNPALASARYNRGLVYYSLKNYEAALTDFNDAIEYDTDDAISYYNRGLVYSGLQRYDEAFADYNRSIELDNNHADSFNNRGKIHALRHLNEEALEDFNRAIALDPQGPLAYSNRGSLFHNSGRYQEAVADYDRAIQLDPAFVQAYIYRGSSNVGLKNLDAAISDYDQAIRLDPASAEAYKNKGIVFHLRNALEEALQMFDKAGQLGNREALQLAELIRNPNPEAILQFAEQEAQRGNEQAAETVQLIKEQIELRAMMESGAHELAYDAILEADSLEDMRLVATQFKFVVRPLFIRMFENIVAGEYTPEQRLFIEQRSIWLRQIAGENQST